MGFLFVTIVSIGLVLNGGVRDLFAWRGSLPGIRVRSRRRAMDFASGNSSNDAVNESARVT